MPQNVHQSLIWEKVAFWQSLSPTTTEVSTRCLWFLKRAMMAFFAGWLYFQHIILEGKKWEKIQKMYYFDRYSGKYPLHGSL